VGWLALFTANGSVVGSEWLRRGGELEGHEDMSVQSLDYSAEEERQQDRRAVVSTSGSNNGMAGWSDREEENSVGRGSGFVCHAKVKREKGGPDGVRGSMGNGPGVSGGGDRRAAQERRKWHEWCATEGDEGEADRWAQVYLIFNVIPNLNQL
jgi:hypothetical protein